MNSNPVVSVMKSTEAASPPLFVRGTVEIISLTITASQYHLLTESHECTVLSCFSMQIYSWPVHMKLCSNWGHRPWPINNQGSAFTLGYDDLHISSSGLCIMWVWLISLKVIHSYRSSTLEKKYQWAKCVIITVCAFKKWVRFLLVPCNTVSLM